LEPNRLLVLAEKGATEIEELIAHSDFRILATMNPGGDFGKKELSPGTFPVTQSHVCCCWAQLTAQ
jgi:midasin (ATPase involved in ribosome maturation)